MRLYLKREDLAHTGAHKINNVLGQGLLASGWARQRLIAETGAGQHGVATATVAALLGLPCVVYMGARDIERQRPNVLRMHTLGAEVRSGRVRLGHAQGRDQRGDARLGDQRRRHLLRARLGDGPASVPDDRARLPARDRRREPRHRSRTCEGRLPDVVVACVGGGSNAIGIFSRFIGEPSVRLVAVEAAGDGIETGHHAAALAAGSMGIIHGARTMLLQDADGQVEEAHSISAGLDYPGVGPQLAALAAEGRLELANVDGQPGARRAAAAGALRRASCPRSNQRTPWPRCRASCAARRPDRWSLVGLSGRGDKDMAISGRRHDIATTAGSRRIGRAFAAASEAGRIAFVPYVVAGYPDMAASETAGAGGARRGRRPAGDRPSLLGSARGWRHSPERQHGRARQRCDPGRVAGHGRARGPCTARTSRSS